MANLKDQKILSELTGDAQMTSTSPPPVFHPLRSYSESFPSDLSFQNITFDEYVVYVQKRFRWLVPYLPHSQLVRYLRLVAFMNFDQLSPYKLNSLQLRDLYLLMALWELDLILQGKHLSQSTMTQIDKLLCAQVPEFYKQGLLTRTDLIIHKQEILSKLLKKTSEKISLGFDKDLPAPIKTQLREILSLTLEFS